MEMVAPPFRQALCPFGTCQTRHEQCPPKIGDPRLTSGLRWYHSPSSVFMTRESNCELLHELLFTRGGEADRLQRQSVFLVVLLDAERFRSSYGGTPGRLDSPSPFLACLLLQQTLSRPFFYLSPLPVSSGRRPCRLDCTRYMKATDTSLRAEATSPKCRMDSIRPISSNPFEHCGLARSTDQDWPKVALAVSSETRFQLAAFGAVTFPDSRPPLRYQDHFTWALEWRFMPFCVLGLCLFPCFDCKSLFFVLQHLPNGLQVFPRVVGMGAIHMAHQRVEFVFPPTFWTIE